MANFTLRRIDRNDDVDVRRWKALLAKADGATIFHDPDFLAYHGSRFDEHHVGVFRGGELFAIAPMALLGERGAKVARSPYGGSYGGFIFASVPSYAEADEIVSAFIAYLREIDTIRAVLGLPVAAYSRKHSDTFAFSLLHHGFRPINSDITSSAPLAGRREAELLTARARRHARKAENAGVACVLGGEVDHFWPLLQRTMEKHQAKSTHSLEEWRGLAGRFPASVWVDIAYVGDRPVAGIGHIMISSRHDCAFYICHDPDWQHTQALSLLMSEAVRDAHRRGCDWFDFGTSSVNMVPRPTNFQFKESFGAVGLFRHSYAIQFD